ncbi:MAG: SRPBCC domain-containing protein [Deinococcota bacterium]
MTMTSPNIQDRTFEVSRSFNAPRELVFAAFSQCEHLKHWWGPKDWELPVCEMDFRVGGSWVYCMRGPDGEGGIMESWGKWVYQEISVPEKIVSTDNFVDSDGNILPDTPDMLTTVVFEDVDGKTLVTNTTVFERKEDLDMVISMGMAEGVDQEFDKLEAYLEQQSS